MNRRTNLTLGTLTMLGAAAAAATALPPPLPDRPARTQQVQRSQSLSQLTFKKFSHDMGQITDESEILIEFPFTNTGSETLEIYDIKSSCGCTAGDLVKKTYAPGESGVITATYNPSGKKGVQNRTLRINSNALGNREVVLTVKGYVTPLVMVEPNILTLPATDKDEPVTSTITVTGRTSDFEVTRATAENFDLFSIEVIGTQQVVQDGETLRQSTLAVTLDPKNTVGRHVAELTIRTNDPRRPLVKANVVGVVAGDAVRNPPRISVGRTIMGKTHERSMTLSHRRGMEFNILSASLEAGPLTGEVSFTPAEPGSKSAYTIDTTLLASRIHPRINQVLVVNTDIPGEERIEIPLMGAIGADR